MNPTSSPDVLGGSDSAAPSRRELNKAATRRSISMAALALLREKGLGQFTVEDIAAAAGISRRTFFNYYSSFEAAMASVADGFLDNALEQFRLRPAGEPVLASAQAALMALADPATIAPMAEFFSLTQENPSLARSELEAWDHCTSQIIDAARERIGTHANELYLRSLAGSVISCGKAAMTVWFEESGADLSPTSLTRLRHYLIDAMGLLGSGFAAQTAPATIPSASTSSPTERH